jgi:hypothetical protein
VICVCCGLDALFIFEEVKELFEYSLHCRNLHFINSSAHCTKFNFINSLERDVDYFQQLRAVGGCGLPAAAEDGR